MHVIKIEKTSDGLAAARAGSIVYAIVARPDGTFDLVSNYGKEDISKMKRSDFYSFLGKVDGMDGFHAYVSDYLVHLEQAKKFGRYEMPSKTRTPWGQSQGATVFVEDGIYCHSTAGHGGFKVFAKLNREIPEVLRNEQGWYEEDCEYAKVIASLPAYFTDREVRLAKESLRNWFPDEYEAVTGETIPEGASFKKDERLFKERHAEDWVVIAASSIPDTHMVNCHATIGGKRGGWENGVEIEVEEAQFHVPAEEYSKRSRHGFVIDLARHERVGEPAAPRR